MEELARCSHDKNLRRGLKLHFGNSDVELDDTAKVHRVRDVMREANARRMPIVIHMHTSISLKRRYGREQALTFLDELLPAAPDVPIQVAHLGGAGGYSDTTDHASGNPAPREAWAAFVSKLPLTRRELDTIAMNRAPYMRW